MLALDAGMLAVLGLLGLLTFCLGLSSSSLDSASEVSAPCSISLVLVIVIVVAALRGGGSLKGTIALVLPAPLSSGTAVEMSIDGCCASTCSIVFAPSSGKWMMADDKSKSEKDRNFDQEK